MQRYVAQDMSDTESMMNETEYSEDEIERLMKEYEEGTGLSQNQR